VVVPAAVAVEIRLVAQAGAGQADKVLPVELRAHLLAHPFTAVVAAVALGRLALRLLQAQLLALVVSALSLRSLRRHRQHRRRSAKLSARPCISAAAVVVAAPRQTALLLERAEMAAAAQETLLELPGVAQAALRTPVAVAAVEALVRQSQLCPVAGPAALLSAFQPSTTRAYPPVRRPLSQTVAIRC
jgi:hypothetical protein